MNRVTGQLLVVIGTFVLAPVLLAGPAFADTTPTPIASEPPGGATCAPGLPTAGCGQDTGTTPTPKPSSTRSTTTSSGSGNSLPATGPASLPRTGGSPAAPWGIAGAGVLAVGAALVAAGSRPRSTSSR